MKAVIYARYSSASQREESIEGQVKECTAYAVRNGYMVIGTYADRAVSGTTDNRPEFQRMIKDSKRKQFDLVIVWKLDRFARNRYVSAKYKSQLKQNGVRVVSANETISEGADGILLESMLEGMAEWYSADLKDKVIRGLNLNADKCLWNGGTLPIGYVVDEEQHLQPNEDFEKMTEKDIVRYSDDPTDFDYIWPEAFIPNSIISNIVPLRGCGTISNLEGIDFHFFNGTKLCIRSSDLVLGTMSSWIEE